MKKLFTFLLLFIAAVGIVSFGPLPAQAQFGTSLDKLDQAVGPNSKTGLQRDIAPAISTVVGAVLGVLGTVFFVLVVYAGVKWMLARGDEGEIEKSKEIIKAAVMGLVVTLAAYAITSFVGTRLTKATNSTPSPATSPSSAPR